MTHLMMQLLLPCRRDIVISTQRMDILMNEALDRESLTAVSLAKKSGQPASFGRASMEMPHRRLTICWNGCSWNILIAYIFTILQEIIWQHDVTLKMHIGRERFVQLASATLTMTWMHLSKC